MTPFLTHDVIDCGRLLAGVASPLAGATVLFVGTVRELTGTEVTAALEYEAYEAMALEVAAAIQAGTRRQWPVVGFAHQHRLGLLGVGEVSIAVAVSTPHRADAFAAARYAVEEHKKRLPVWKRDIRPTGESAWVHPEGSP